MIFVDNPVDAVKEFNALRVDVVIAGGSWIVVCLRTAKCFHRVKLLSNLVSNRLGHEIIWSTCREKNRNGIAGDLFIGKHEQLVFDQRESQPESTLIVVVRTVDASVTQ